MANILTDLAADIYKAADVVGHELTGLSSSVTVNGSGSERAALGDTVRSHFTREATAVDNTPSMTIPQGTDQTVDNKTMTMDKSRGVQIPWTGEDVKHVNNGSGFETIYGDQIAQAMRTLSNEIETDIGIAAYQGASRSVGVAGTTPFGSNFDIVAEARQELVDNGCPANELTMVLNTLAGTKLRNLAQLQKVNEAGSDTLLRQGVLLDLQGLALKESAGIASHASSGVTGTLVNGTVSIGDTAIPVDTGSGAANVGDVITFAGDTNQYTVAAATTTLITLNTGVLIAPADDAAITVAASYTGNVAFRRSAVELAIRAPAMPLGGDAAVDNMMVQDPFSGLVFDISVYQGFQKQMINVSAVWGVKAWKPEHIVGILG